MAEQTVDRAIEVCNLKPASGCRTKTENHNSNQNNNHLILYSIGGKWTTYRSMAEQTVDRAIEVCNLKPASGCRTKTENHNSNQNNNHLILYSIGGKWTTYRSMAEQTVDRAIEVCNLKPASGCRTKTENHNSNQNNNHLILYSIGGKWTTYRSMAEQTVDRAIEVCNLKPASGCRTKGLMLDGAHGWSPTMFIRLVQDFGLENEVSVMHSRSKLKGNAIFNQFASQSIELKETPVKSKMAFPSRI